MKTKVVILNGPPGCGKDTLGEIVMDTLKAQYSPEHIYHGQFKKILLEILSTTLRVSEVTLMHIYNNRELKETPLPIFGGHSIREAMISISEDYVKPIFGKDYIGRVELTNLIIGKPKIAIYTDGGFIDEVRPLLNHDSIELQIIQIHRDGCSFSSDSRGWLDGDEVKHCLHVAMNNGTLAECSETIMKILNN